MVVTWMTELKWYWLNSEGRKAIVVIVVIVIPLVMWVIVVSVKQ